MATPLPLLPCSLREGDKSASAQIKPFSRACPRMSWMRKLFPLPYLPMSRRRALPPSAILSRSDLMAAISSTRPMAIYGAPVRGTTPAESEVSNAERIRRGTTSCSAIWSPPRGTHE